MVDQIGHPFGQQNDPDGPGVTIAVDAMGGDHGPAEVVPGAIDHARSHPADTVLLVGDEATIRSIAGELPANVEIVHASEVIGMDEHPALALREKKDATILVDGKDVVVTRTVRDLVAGSFLEEAPIVPVSASASLEGRGNVTRRVYPGLRHEMHNEPESPAVIGDTIGDPFKDTAGPAINPMIKVVNIIAILIAASVASHYLVH